ERIQDEGLTSELLQESSNALSDRIDSLLLNCDVGNWATILSDGLRIDIIKRKSQYFQNKEGPFEAIQRTGENMKGQTCQLRKSWFYKHLPNGEKVLRKWMVYSPSKNSLFCFCCRLFTLQNKEAAGVSKFITGFQNWWKVNPKVSQHENYDDHLNNFEKWKTLEASLELNKTID
ncbi:hypothetical protein RN001_001056, partial [Aquatica leii]